jgi:hypothetical protein
MLGHHLPVADAQRRLTLMRERYEELGPVAVQFLEGVLRTQRCGRNQAQRMLGRHVTLCRRSEGVRHQAARPV